MENVFLHQTLYSSIFTLPCLYYILKISFIPQSHQQEQHEINNNSNKNQKKKHLHPNDPKSGWSRFEDGVESF